MRAKNTLTYSFLVMILVLLLVSSVPALKVTVKNSKMVVKLEPGEKLTRTIGIVNDNDVAVNVSLGVSGDLESNIKLAKENYTLEPQEELQAAFTITAPKKEGTNETNILVKFSSGEGSPVGFAAAVVVITDKEGNNQVDATDDEEVEEDNTNSSSSNPITGNVVDSISSIKFNPLYILLISTVILALILVTLIIFTLKKKRTYAPTLTKPKKTARMNA